MAKTITAGIRSLDPTTVEITWDYADSDASDVNLAVGVIVTPHSGAGADDGVLVQPDTTRLPDRTGTLPAADFTAGDTVYFKYYGSTWTEFMSFAWPSPSDPVDPPPTSFPTDWSYITGHAPGATGPFVTGFAIVWVPDQLNLSWDTFVGASHYKLQVRHSLATTFLELALISQASGPVQGFVLVDWADDARFMPGQDYVFRVRVED